MAKKLNSMRRLEAQGIDYVERRFPDTVHSAQGVAEHFGLPASQVYKTLVLFTARDTPFLLMVPGNIEVDLKRLAQSLNEKKLRMASQREAERLTGLKVGGISALAVRPGRFPVYLADTAKAETHILISAGQRGMNLELEVGDLMRVTDATFVAATPPHDAAPD